MPNTPPAKKKYTMLQQPLLNWASASMSMSAKQRPKWPVVRSGMMGVRLSHIWRIAVSSTYRSLPHIACT